MTVFDALILGVVQGFTEFVPVSSSAHLVLVPEFFGISTPTVAFDVLVHLATLIAVVGYFIGDVSKMVASVVAPKRMSRQEVKYWRRMILWLVVGSIPAALAGLILGDFFEGLFSSTLAVGVFLVVTSALLWAADFALGRVNKQPAGIDKLRGADALVVGCFQALAIAPGLSRSGATMSAGVFLGFDRSSAAHFSFLLSIPAILGAFLFKVKDIGEAVGGGNGLAYLMGAIAAGISGFIAIYFVMRYVRNHRFRVFAIYTLALGLFVILLSVV